VLTETQRVSAFNRLNKNMLEKKPVLTEAELEKLKTMKNV
jgi:hypothetical protein